MQHILVQYESLQREIDAVKAVAAKENRNLNAEELAKVADFSKRSDELAHQVEAYTAMSKAEKAALEARSKFNQAPADKPNYSNVEKDERDQFSLSRAIQAIALGGMNAKFEAPEAEAIKLGMEEARALPGKENSFFIPMAHLARSLPKTSGYRKNAPQSRAYNVAGNGTDLVQTDVAYFCFIFFYFEPQM